MDDRRATAIHEAGHALAAHLLDLPFRLVTIIQADDELGSVDTGNPLVGWERGDGPRRPLLERWAVSIYAGWAAEMVVTGSAIAGHEADFETARHWIAETVRPPGCSSVGDAAFEAYEDRLRQRAIGLLSSRRQTLERIAAALLERETLTFADVAALIDGPAGRP